MRLVAEGRVTLHASEYGLDDVNARSADLEADLGGAPWTRP